MNKEQTLIKNGPAPIYQRNIKHLLNSLTCYCGEVCTFEIWSTEVQLELTKIHTFSMKNLPIHIFAVRKTVSAQ
jgi:hypothetical protein